ncbi:MAG: ribonuclease Y [Candidatus Yanofskybacteria bacterium]|nr:ribonuclease Y [Candidatus Yanofskybacteria bacterium]
MDALLLIGTGLGALVLGSLLGYYARQSIARKRAGSVEQKLKKRIAQVEEESQAILEKARQEGKHILSEAKQEEDERRKEILKTEQLLLKRESLFEQKLSDFESQQNEIQAKETLLKDTKEKLEQERADIVRRLEAVAKLSQEEAKSELFGRVEAQHEKDILGRIRQLEAEGKDRFDARAREIVSYAIQKIAVPQTQEITTSTVILPSEEMKGKIIGKEGRNIRALERAAGVEIIVDEAPETVVISGFDAVRRHIAKTALERLIQDGRIHPARVEEEVAKVQGEIEQQMKEAGETAIYEVGIVGIDPKLVFLLGRLKFRTSYGQNVLLHSIEVAHLAAALAAEIGADAQLSKKAGLFHDIGKALDHQIEGSHVEIGMRVLEKFGMEKAVISAMKSHHEDYPYESIEAVLVQTADAISASRPGARKDTLENYLKRIGELEQLAASFGGVEKVYAIQAGREIRIFVHPSEVSDLEAHQLARDVASRIQEELRYPGEIKVTLIRENRFVEYAR